jgi:hypothetical protein
VITFFTPTNTHVIYYNKGKRTIRVFRSIDGRQIADMKCQAKVRQAYATTDGRALIVGYEDGAVQMFLIVDRFEQSNLTYLKNWRKNQLESTIESEQQEVNERQPEPTMS